MDNLESLFDHTCSRCSLSMSARTICVGGVGNHKNRIMALGEAPGRNEDKSGIPFVGAAGRILDTSLQKAGLSRTEIYVTNIVKCRPPKNRAPESEEVKKCGLYLDAEVFHIQPTHVLLLGASALKAILNQDDISQRRGVWQEQETDWGQVFFMPTYHPAACLYRPQLTPFLEDDIKDFVGHWRKDKIKVAGEAAGMG